ncbi:hypothetical protein AXG93_3671s1330 [Marchantia polymorpha subsp. ruderalis]|uniref:Uncharacterized protein n=1 Tax=Marchantia polymorpha subsp. ruderalis TaxID=1480154 RepID=A0A176WHP7_MARPO|nr:hypothetical protein AXG93_3671s1330 [Marchantia polymorpha subsp. ruderalis]
MKTRARVSYSTQQAIDWYVTGLPLEMKTFCRRIKGDNIEEVISSAKAFETFMLNRQRKNSCGSGDREQKPKSSRRKQRAATPLSNESSSSLESSEAEDSSFSEDRIPRKNVSGKKKGRCMAIPEKDFTFIVSKVDALVKDFTDLKDGVDINGGVSGIVASGALDSSTSGGTNEGTRSGPSAAGGGGTRSGTTGHTDDATNEDTSSGTSSTAVGSLGVATSVVPTFNPIAEFFKRGAPRGQGGRGAGAGAIRRHVVGATSTTEVAMAARIEHLEQRLAAMASSGAGASISHEGEDFSYLASAAQVEASVVVTRAMLCERGSVTTTSAEIRKGTVGEQPSTSTLKDETTWQEAAARIELSPARLAIVRKRIVLDVCMVDNQSGLFCLVSSTGQAYVQAKGLLNIGAQPLMLGKAARISLGVWRSELELCPFKNQTSRGVANDRLMKKAWSEASLREEIGGLAAMLQSGIPVCKYLYVEKYETAR